MTTTPTATEEVPVGTRKTEEGLDHTEAIGMVEARQMIQIQEGETDSIRDFKEDVDPEAIQGHQAQRDLGDRQDQQDRRETQGMSQEWGI